MSSRLQRKIRKRKWLEAHRENYARRSKYATKKWIEEHGTPPKKKGKSE